MPKLKYVVAALLLFIVSPVMAQQFVRQDERNNPCRRFKMVVLVPVDLPTRDMPVVLTDNSIDPKMVWNPCPGVQSQIAATIQPAPKPPDNFQATPNPLLPVPAPKTFTSEEMRKLLEQLDRLKKSNRPK